ncbi:MAG: tRNA (adenosine(37)-N6)-threonylcarbamoyltransferase complex ATPase subunit type 1 TsaE [Yoonia sp.]|uniref:tRNA (adenosine(37)-N6)-threonylcarbamoyltransferase complex ATPase subunit type 1 TsaE n=1 Tax=Yoonia sp. TaxID=2212373 RepID=UPI003266AD52
MTTTSLFFPLESDTQRFAAQMSTVLAPGDTILLSGDIGAGKSAFSRAVIRAMVGAEIDVPSPTFTLVQTYETETAEIWHCDLYRLTHPDEAFELGLDEAFETAICLIEWPDRLGNDAPSNALTLHFQALENGHSVTYSPNPAWAKRLDHLND